MKKIKKCPACSNPKLIFIKEFEREDFNNKIVESDVWLCKECETITYYEGKTLSFEFFPNIDYGPEKEVHWEV